MKIQTPRGRSGLFRNLESLGLFRNLLEAVLTPGTLRVVQRSPQNIPDKDFPEAFLNPPGTLRVVQGLP